MSTRLEINTRIKDISDDLEEGMSRQEIINTYTEKWGVTQRTIDRYMMFAADILSARMSKREAMLDVMRGEVIAEAMEKTMRSSLELEAKLCAIAEGEMEIEKKVHVRGDVVTVKQRPNYNEILRAIDRLFRMRGCYDPKERKIAEPRPEFKLVLHKQSDYDIINGMKEKAEKEQRAKLREDPEE